MSVLSGTTPPVEQLAALDNSFEQFAGTTPSLEQLAAAQPSMSLDTDMVTRGFVPRNALVRLGKEEDAVLAAEKARELIKHFSDEESSIKNYLRTTRGVIVTDDHIAQEPKAPGQLSAESGSFADLQQLTDDLLAQCLVLRFHQDSDLAKFGAKIVVRDRSMTRGLEAYAKSRGLDLGN
ncbi:hypothetical protein B0T26DRAFT_753121 [Lasiosphaeria miniovina]|uniref:Uncharacterized protein n=1 Tax=Lasiosphaeria miniovina TaxID=1954250 RepID=A0AA40ABT0_9PEZI|nr:uncharacterized protein B0T26DRAFT_753121 [Lasiosphaeria miniovina]KAK0712946.1 hypothetical protein B0T26DRAFT_753121 [Lasiosphaeria miniovina]